MQFDTQVLRVQIPCRVSGSVVNTAEFCGHDHPRSVVYITDITDLEFTGCRGGTHFTDPGCGGSQNPDGCTQSDIIRTELTEILYTKHVTQRFLLEPEDLPQLREQLELKLKMLSVVADATAAARRRLKANLSDIEASEKTLRNMSNG